MAARLLSVLLLISLLVMPCVAQEGGLSNDSFEEVDAASANRADGSLPSAWMNRSATSSAHRLTDDARTGKRAALIEFTEGSGNAISGYYYSDVQPLKPSSLVTVSAYVKVNTAEGNGAYLRLLFRSGEAYTKIVDGGHVTNTDGGWRLLTVSGVPPADADAWRMSIEYSGIGTAIFDDAAVEFAPPARIEAATRTAPSGKLMNFGEGRWGMLGEAVKAEEGLVLNARIQGKSVLPPALQLGTVWYHGDEQLAVIVRDYGAWMTPDALSVTQSYMAHSDAVRPIVFGASRTDWEAADVSGLSVSAAPSKTLAPAEIVPAAHPRLFVSGAQFAQLRELARMNPDELAKTDPALASELKQLRAYADAAFSMTEIVVYGGRYRTSVPPAWPPSHEDNFPYWTGLSREIEKRIEALATMYLLTGETKYGELSRDWMLALCKWERWNDPNYSSQPSCLDTGHFCYAAAFAYDFLYDMLTEDERVTIRTVMLDKGAQAVMDTGEKGWATGMGWPNGFAVVMGGMGIVGMAALGDDPRGDEYVQYARRRLHEFFDVRDRDGGYVEGFVYGGYAMSHVMPFAGTLALHGDDALTAHPYIQRTMKFITYCQESGTGTSVDFCDSNYTTRAYNSTAGWLARNGSGLAQWYLENSGGLENLWEYTPPLAVLWHPLDTPAEAPTSWPTVAHYRDIGWTIMRTGFEREDPARMLFAMRSGYPGSHCQLDQNSFMLNVGGDWLLSDPGYGVGATSRHSTLLVSDSGQAGASARVVAFGKLGKLSYSAGDAAACYEGLDTFTRNAVMLANDTIVIFDELAPTDDAVEVASQFVRGGEAVVNGKSATIAGSDGRPGCTLTFADDDALKLSDDGSKVVQSYTVGRPTFKSVVIRPGTEPTEVVRADQRGVRAMWIVADGHTDIVMLNVSGRTRTARIGDAQLISDGHLTWLRLVAGQVTDMAVVRGSRVKLNGEMLFVATERQDYAK